MSDGTPATTTPNVLNYPAPPDGSWVTTNISEALPGVVSPLGWSLWGDATDYCMRVPFHAMGAMPSSGLFVAENPENRVCSIFFGRIALRVDFFCEMGDLIPGASGEAVARDALGYVPPDYTPSSSKRRWPMFLVRMPIVLTTTRPKAIRAHDQTREIYRRETRRAKTLDLNGARAQYSAAVARFRSTMAIQAVTITAVIQPAFSAVTRVAEQADVDPGSLMRGYGSHVESELIEDLWQLSREEIRLDTFLDRHGHHGPDAGELSNPSWRVDPAPLLRTVAGYRGMPDSGNPLSVAASAAAQREQAERDVLAALPRSKRAGARFALALGRRNLPLRSHARLAYLYEVDIARAAALRAGELLALDGTLEAPEDVFYLTGEELIGSSRFDARPVVAERRALRAEYEKFELPAHWTGLPRPTPITVAGANGDRSRRIEALGVSPGHAEGIARVVEDPAETGMETGDILVTHTTDPSWASIMYLAGALVVDVGGQLSHAAVVARELGVPCVMNTRVGTQTLRTGDRVRVDGGAGTVEILGAEATGDDR